MIIFWLAALLPIIFGGLLFFFGKQVNWREWVVSTVIALCMAGLFQLCATLSMTSDIETWSGQVNNAQQFSEWDEYYEYAVYHSEPRVGFSTDDKGHTETYIYYVDVFDHWEPSQRHHNASWHIYTTLDVWDIDFNTFNYLHEKFGAISAGAGQRTTGDHASRMIGGDPNDYVIVNQNRWVEPVTTTKTFKNRVKAAPSTFSFCKVPTNAPIFKWPENPNHFRSDRVLGTARQYIDILKWDQMNAYLGPTKKVNLIIIGFGEQDHKIAEYQESAWVGGKKNDLVICYGNTKAEDGGIGINWVKVFGWTERKDVKEHLETIVKNNPVNNDLIPLITEEVARNYVIKDWTKFDNVTIEPPTWAYILYFSMMVSIHGLFYFWCSINRLGKYYKQSYESWWTDLMRGG
jgi:hypothetical protein